MVDIYPDFSIDYDPLSLLGSIGYLGRYLVGHKNLKNCRALKFLLSTENITRSLLPTFHCPEQIKDKVLELSDLSLQITIQNGNSYVVIVVVVVKLMHNCHFVQLAVFVLKKFLFSSRQQKSWLFFDNQQPRSMSPRKRLVQKQLLKMLLYFHLGIFIATQCLGDFLAAIVALTYSILDCMDYPGMTQYTGCF